METTAEQTLIPFSKLFLDQRNPPKIAPPELAQLVASIEHHGLLQNLIVTKVGDDRFGVVAGGRRWRAIRTLINHGKTPADPLIPCLVRSAKNAVEVSVAENRMREPMHPADEFEAFKEMIDGGSNVEDVAARFGTTPTVVLRRLQLAKVAPKLIQIYRTGDASLEQLMALAITTDQKAQLRAWDDAKTSWERTPDQLRKKLAKGEVQLTKSRLARFVGITAYEAAGGSVERDLFSDAGDAFFSDSTLVETLATTTLEEAAAAVRAEGWQWVTVDAEFESYNLYRYTRLEATIAELTKPQKARVKELEKEIASLDKRIDAFEADDNYGQAHDDAADARDRVAAELSDIEESRKQWGADEKARAGAIVSISDAGKLRVYRGLVSHKQAAGGLTENGKAKKPAKPALSDSLARRLTAHRTAALQLQLLEQPHIALAMLVYTLIRSVISASTKGAGARGTSPVRASVENKMDSLIETADDLKATPLWKQLQTLRGEILAPLPKQDKDLLPYLIALPQQDLLQLLALCTAFSTSAVTGEEGPNAADALAEAVGLDMAHWWEATPASYLDHVSKAIAIEAVAEATTKKEAEALASMKKAELSSAAAAKLAGTGWLPKILRGPKKPKTVKPVSFTPARSKAPAAEPADVPTKASRTPRTRKPKAAASAAPADAFKDSEWPFPTDARP